MENFLADIQSQPPAIPMRINRVGIRNLALPLAIRQKNSEKGQQTVARFSLAVDLPPSANGTHMSRFVDELQAFACADEGMDYGAALNILRKTCKRMGADKAFLTLAFPFFISKKAPVSKIAALVAYQCTLEAEIGKETTPKTNLTPYTISVTVPVMTVCPCSKAISREGAHSQRAEIRIRAKMKGHVWLEDLIELAEKSGSSPVYSLLKRPDEKFVTEYAFANPCFVEDTARNVASALSALKNLESFSVEVESFESIHAHNAFAYIEG